MERSISQGVLLQYGAKSLVLIPRLPQPHEPIETRRSVPFPVDPGQEKRQQLLVVCFALVSLFAHAVYAWSG